MMFRRFRVQYNSRLDRFRVQWIPSWFPAWWPLWVTPQAQAEDGSRDDRLFDSGADVNRYIVEEIRTDGANPRWREAGRDDHGRWRRRGAAAEASARRPTLLKRLQNLWERNHHGSHQAQE